MMTLEILNLKRDILERNVDALSIMLNDFPKGTMGLMPETVRLSPQYIETRKAFKLAFNELRAVNAARLKLAKLNKP